MMEWSVMQATTTLLLAIWRELCRAPEIQQSTERIAALLREHLPVDLVLVQHVDLQRSCVEIVAAGWVEDRNRPGKTRMIEQKKLDRILVRSGHPGRTTRTVEYLVRGSGNLEVTYSTVKGGTVSTTVRVR